jgi:peptidoglycan hydrolase-like protein with peptidoglycan-binding domain
MAEKNKDNTIMYVFGGLIAVVGLFFVFGKKKNDTQITQDLPIDTGGQPVQTQTQTIILNGGLLLKKGSSGYEVKELQKRLGISADGVFGSQTEAALFAKKHVYQITLNQYSNGVAATTTTTTTAPASGFKYKVGDNLIVTNPKGAVATNYDLNYTGVFVSEKTTEKLELNQLAGKVVKLFNETGTGKAMYMVEHAYIMSKDYLLVREADVTKHS